jgi:hypothetical protein
MKRGMLFPSMQSIAALRQAIADNAIPGRPAGVRKAAHFQEGSARGPEK